MIPPPRATRDGRKLWSLPATPSRARLADCAQNRRPRGFGRSPRRRKQQRKAQKNRDPGTLLAFLHRTLRSARATADATALSATAPRPRQAPAYLRARFACACGGARGTASPVLRHLAPAVLHRARGARHDDPREAVAKRPLVPVFAARVSWPLGVRGLATCRVAAGGGKRRAESNG